MFFEAPLALLLQSDYLEMLRQNGPVESAILIVLICFSIYSWTVIFSKLSSLRGARTTNAWKFMRCWPSGVA